MAPTAKVLPFVIPLLLAAFFVPPGYAQQQPTKAVELMGLPGVKSNAKGFLTVENGNLQFTHSKSTTDLPAKSMQDVITGSDSQRVIGGTVGTLSMFAPYGSGLFLSLFRSKLDTLTIQYLDANGGLHGVIFTSPVGTAEVTKGELVESGAHTSIPTGEVPAPGPDQSVRETPTESSQEGKPAKIHASAIKVMMIQSDEIKLPAEFQVSLYENLVQQLQNKGGFQHVYREGDRNAEAFLISLFSTAPFEASSRAVKWRAKSPRSPGRPLSGSTANSPIRRASCCLRGTLAATWILRRKLEGHL